MENTIIYSVISFIVGGLVTFLFARRSAKNTRGVEDKADELIEKAKSEASRLRDEAKNKAQDGKKNAQKAEKTFKELLKQIEESIRGKEEVLKKRKTRMKELQEVIKREQKEIEAIKEKNSEVLGELTVRLEKRAGKKANSLKEAFLRQHESRLREDNKNRLIRLVQHHEEYAEREGRNIVLNVSQRLTLPTSNEKKGTQVKVTRDAVKPNLVGKNGENIRAFEEELEVDVIFNDFPQTITISHYNLLTREIAKVAMKKLCNMRGKITKETVLRVIEEARKDTDTKLIVIGKEALYRMNIKRELPDGLLRVVGRLQFRTSYGQNIMKHSYEVGVFALMIGCELGLDTEVCKVAGFLHDLGKAIDQNPDIIGAHDYLTKELMEKYNFPEDEIHAAFVHHDAEPQKTPEALIIKAADAISAGRPGARRESLEKYIERIKALESIAKSYEGVKKVQSMSAGRELRVKVASDEVEDAKLKPLATEIAGEIKENVAYPGYVNVKVIRKIEHTEVAK